MMNGSYHGFATENTVDNLIKSSPAWASSLVEVKSGMTGNQYPKEILDVCGQKPTDYSLYDAFCFSQIYGRILSGDALVVVVDVGSSPRPDRRKEENSRALEGLPEPFIASSWFDKFECDGCLRWNMPIRLGQLTSSSEYSTMIDPGQAPLEVGNTQFSRSLLHLFQCGYLARWPYDQKSLWLIYLSSSVPSIAEDPKKNNKPRRSSAPRRKRNKIQGLLF